MLTPFSVQKSSPQQMVMGQQNSHVQKANLDPYLTMDKNLNGKAQTIKLSEEHR